MQTRQFHLLTELIIYLERQAGTSIGTKRMKYVLNRSTAAEGYGREEEGALSLARDALHHELPPVVGGGQGQLVAHGCSGHLWSKEQ